MSKSEKSGRAGILFVICAPSGSGKSTICDQLLYRLDNVRFSVSFTSRSPRPGEKNGVHYHFITKSGFEKKRDEGLFLEWAQYADNYYGTEKTATETQLSKGRDLLLDIEVQGAGQVKDKMGDSVVRIFILPPSSEELVARLEKRGKNTESELNKRLSIAHREIEEAVEFEYIVVNDNLDQAVDDVAAIIMAERNRSWRNRPKAIKVLRSFQ